MQLKGLLWPVKKPAVAFWFYLSVRSGKWHTCRIQYSKKSEERRKSNIINIMYVGTFS